MNETRSERICLAFTGACALLTAIGSLFYLMIALSSLIMIQPAFGQSTAAVRLEAGIAKEDVDGDLKAAVEIYQKIAADRSAPRDVRSKALLRLAGCYEKLGGQKAQQVYEQVVRDFAEQPAAAQARSRLASLVKLEHPEPPPTMTVRQIKSSGLGLMGPGDTDGQRAVYLDPSNGLFYGDLAGHTKRLVFKSQPGEWLRWNPSKDFSMVTLEFRNPDQPATIAVVKTDGTGYRELVREDVKGTVPGRNWRCCVWSWDSRYILGFAPGQTKGGHLMLVSVADGGRRELLNLESGEFEKAAFSPDGRFVAYEVSSVRGGSENSQIFITPAQRGEPRLVYESDGMTSTQASVLLDWTADGRNLAIFDVRKGKKGLFLLPLKEGEAAGIPVLVRAGHIERGFMTAAGTLVFQGPRPGGVYNVSVASLDPDGRLGRWRRLDLRGDNLHRHPWPSFSPEGARIAYMSEELEGTGGAALVLQDLSNGQEQILYRSLDGELSCHYANRHPKIFCSDGKVGKTDLISVSAESGEVERLGSFADVRVLNDVSGDDHAVYFLKSEDGDNLDIGQVMRWDIDTRQDTSVGRYSDTELTFASLDDRWLVRFAGKSLSVRPLSGGDWRTLASVVKPRTSLAATTPDGEWVLYYDEGPAGKLILFRAPIAGGQPQRLGDMPENSGWGTLHISFDGRRILAATTVPGDDLFVLENFVPPAKQ